MIAAIQCRKCDEVIWSKHRHDFVSCPCKACAVDGGRDYTRILGEREDYILGELLIAFVPAEKESGSPTVILKKDRERKAIVKKGKKK